MQLKFLGHKREGLNLTENTLCLRRTQKVMARASEPNGSQNKETQGGIVERKKKVLIAAKRTGCYEVLSLPMS